MDSQPLCIPYATEKWNTHYHTVPLIRSPVTSWAPPSPLANHFKHWFPSVKWLNLGRHRQCHMKLHSMRSPPTRMPNAGWAGSKIGWLSTNNLLYLDNGIQERCIASLDANSKSYACYRMVTLPMTLSLVPHNHSYHPHFIHLALPFVLP